MEENYDYYWKAFELGKMIGKKMKCEIVDMRLFTPLIDAFWDGFYAGCTEREREKAKENHLFF